MRPAPVPGLTPLWGNGRDWLPGDPVQGDLSRTPELIVEETMTTLRPGGLPRYWDACREFDRQAESLSRAHLLGGFHTLVGQQHQALVYRCYPDFARLMAHRAERAGDPAGRAFMDAVRADIVREETLLLRPSPLPAATPLLRYPAN